MSGQKAVQNGKAFESKIFAVLNQLPSVNVIKDIPYPSIYSAYSTKHKTKMEFRAENISLTFETLDAYGNKVMKTRLFKTLNIECKYQEDSGTTDEKYPLVYENALISDAEATLFVYEDPLKNIKRGALEFMYDKALNSGERLIVMDFDCFLANVNKQYSMSLAPDVLDQGSELFQVYHLGLKALESLSRKRFNGVIRTNNQCSEFFDEYLHCQRDFHNFVARHGVQSRDYIPYLEQLRSLRANISTYF
ncbi:PD-(D/E)XK nuclease superfamily protein [uncultured Photobacterium sp.]|uniref:PD-(D/E)XK nuclease superfamily protein n=1 Tax=uncultured Photobacterium sp. TaxID=173973 RepID=UPI0026342FC7|nr:PD-(D/E)XK nuclease superfamily protein [uncultured Photobacterium sp.]